MQNAAWSTSEVLAVVSFILGVFGSLVAFLGSVLGGIAWYAYKSDKAHADRRLETLERDKGASSHAHTSTQAALASTSTAVDALSTRVDEVKADMGAAMVALSTRMKEDLAEVKGDLTKEDERTRSRVEVAVDGVHKMGAKLDMLIKRSSSGTGYSAVSDAPRPGRGGE